ncbi:MAG: NifU N-terminal domain-containing protein [Pyrinomonadaceae bacterium]|nr:NifU N-terminal domain-containing protein [Phycisphaerales bacterium]
MPYTVTKYQSTPNPNALKCFLSGTISDRPKSFRKPEEAEGDALAAKFFAVSGVTSLLINGDWMTVNKSSEVEWGGVKRGVERVLLDLA